MTNQQKGLVLVGLIVAWGGITAYQMSDFSGSTSGDPSSNMPQTSSTLPTVKALFLDQASPNPRQMVTFSQPRNIFSPLGARKVVAKPSKKNPRTATAPKPTMAAPAPAGPSPAELAAQRAREQLNQFRFLGYLTKGGESQAFLTNGQAIYIVKQGEMLEGQVQVNKIEPETIVLSTQVWESGNQVQATIPLTPETRS